MSQTETHFGKLRKIEIEPNQTVEEWCLNKCLEISDYNELPSYYDSWKDLLKYEFDRNYFFIDDQIWVSFDHIESEDDDINYMNLNEDGTITFIMQFYNGGTCLSELIEEGLEKLK